MGSDDFFLEVTGTWLVTEEVSPEEILSLILRTKASGVMYFKTFFFSDFTLLGFEGKLLCLSIRELQI